MKMLKEPGAFVIAMLSDKRAEENKTTTQDMINALTAKNIFLPVNNDGIVGNIGIINQKNNKLDEHELIKAIGTPENIFVGYNGNVNIACASGLSYPVEYIKKLGFGKTTGIDLPGEASGIVKKTENITESDLATISFGQTNTVTAIQYMQAFNALANGGSLIQPHIMKEVSHYNSDDTKVIDETYEPVISKNVLSDKSTATLRDYLERTVNEGGSNKSYIEGYHIGGKTGTAQKVNSVTGGYESGKYISSMAAMAPVDSPEITAFVSIDEPSNGAYYAGVVTAPLMKILLTDIFNYMDSEFSEDYNAVVRDVLIPEIRGKSIEEAKKILKDVNLEYNIEGSGEIVTNTQPYPGYTVKEGTKITIYTGDAVDNNKVSMPDLTGLSVTSAKDILDDLGIKYSLEGDGFVIDQSIPAGEVITTGSNVRLTLSDDYGD